jgi:CheY-like chemotaxis protein
MNGVIFVYHFMPKPLQVLLVDDDLDDHDFCKEALSGLPEYDVNLIPVYHGLQALDYLLRRGSYQNVTDPQPDLIILDLNMPIMNGWDVLKELKREKTLEKIPVYVLTTSRSTDDAQKCERFGCSGFFSKPPKLNELRNVLAKIFSGR